MLGGVAEALKPALAGIEPLAEDADLRLTEVGRFLHDIDRSAPLLIEQGGALSLMETHSLTLL